MGQQGLRESRRQGQKVPESAGSACREKGGRAGVAVLLAHRDLGQVPRKEFRGAAVY